MSQNLADRNSSADNRLFEILQNDLRTLSADAKKKFPMIKESCEEGIVKLRNAQSNPQTPLFYIVNQILYPFVQGCETKDPKIVKICLGMIQKLITEQAVDQKGARCITDTLWMLMESGTEEVKVLQSVTLLLTTNGIVHGDILAKNLVLCFRLHFAKDSTTINTAGATIRQLVSLVFERVVAEDEKFGNEDESGKEINFTELRTPRNVPPKGLQPCAGDAYLMFQDLVLLVNADQPYWMTGMTEMTRIFGLELLELILIKFPQIFHRHPEFSFLLKERVCALVIKLFSPNIKYRCSATVGFQNTPLDKPFFPISMRLCRVVEILVHHYQTLLVTECEIFLSLIVKFLDPDKPSWQRSLALEVLHHLTVDPKIVKAFCECYDLKAHSTNIFQDIVNSLGAYVKSLFSDPNNVGQSSSVATTVGQGHSGLLTAIPPGPGTLMPGFFYRGIWLPLVVTFTPGQAKLVYLEMFDKNEAPTVPDGYGISVAYACLLSIVHSISDSMKFEKKTENGEVKNKEATEDSDSDKNLQVQLVVSSWCGLLAALVPLIESSTDEMVTENLLKAMQTFASFCGLLNLENPRDAFIIAICKASLPPQYALNVLNVPPFNYNSSNCNYVAQQESNSQYSISGYGVETDFRQQVVAVGTPLPTSSSPFGAQQGPVMLTSKNLQCMRALLNFAHNHGTILGTAWHVVLTTLQHLVWILRLKPSTGGSLKAGKISADSNAVITTAVMADLPELSSMLSRLFESSQYLDDVALHHLIDALCKLSQEAMELAYSNREPSLFAVAKLLETGLVNLHRVEVFWRPLTSHLLEVCQHPHIRMREWGVEAITYLLKVALQHKYQPPLRSNQNLQTLVLAPLSELSSVPHGDVRQRQLECMLHVLHSSGETLCHAWPLVLTTIGAVSDYHGENLIRIAFQCLQLVVTDFLPVMPWSYLPLCVNTTAKFGSQTQELNISLTAVGLMWNISDYFYQNQEKLTQTLSVDSTVFPDFPGMPDMPPFDKLWMCLYTKLGELCVDKRPAVRKSAGQTLFSTISAHGDLLCERTWQTVLWQVLFPLLDKVRAASNCASSEKVDTGGNILIHHSRNTAQKQWAETQVLTLLGVAKVFDSKRKLLQRLGDFQRFWTLFLEFLEVAALNNNSEVSLSSLKAFQEVLYWRTKGGVASEDEENPAMSAEEESNIKWSTWQVWLNIGIEATSQERVERNPPTQHFLTALMQIFPDVFLPIKTRFGKNDLEKLCQLLEKAVLVPPHCENTFMMPSVSDVHITHLQDGILDAIELIAMGAADESWPASIRDTIAQIFEQLFRFTKFACPPSEESEKSGAEWNGVNYIPFGERAMDLVAWMYEKSASCQIVLESSILEKIIQAFHGPLCSKHNSSSPNTWNLAATCFIRVLKIGLPLARKQPQYFTSMWACLSDTLDKFLFPKNTVVIDKTPEESKADEAIDCQIIELIRDQVLKYYTIIPKEFLMQVVVLLNMGSIHTATNKECKLVETKLREEFAKICFETLLDFSLMDNEESSDESSKADSAVAGRLAVTSLLHRFETVLRRFVEEEKSAGKCPPSRHQVSEVSFVLKAIATLVQSLKKAPSEKVGHSTWQQLISLYPCLVDCVTTSSPEIALALREALVQYSHLLQIPKS
ncbi:UNVERIFIED_CONTAM: hypothetical protein PYX00_010542 [Menopon gallinae]|uniref:Protein MON2 homolog n=1 Tax=Menopon gallinae TaxID=328185 RepID=A0AAW2HG23_9NEOP